MSFLHDAPPLSPLQFYATADYDCSYLPEQRARSQVATPEHLIDTAIYSALVRSGFRRSGLYTYRPHCDACHACQPVRLDARAFKPNRSQRRALLLHAGLAVEETTLTFREEHYDLYQRYQTARHAGGGMDTDNREQYANFLLSSHIDTRLFEFRDQGRLRIVSLIDVLDDGLSAVYSFYDPDIRCASFGTFAVLWQIAQCRYAGLPWLYLGYWIATSRKMAYKAKFRPLQVLRHGQWQHLHDENTPIPPSPIV